MAIPSFNRPDSQSSQPNKLGAAPEPSGKSTFLQHVTGAGRVQADRRGRYQQSREQYRKDKIELRKAERKEQIEIEKDLEKKIEFIKERKYRHGELEKKLQRAQAADDNIAIARLQQRLDHARELAREQIEPLERHTWKDFEETNRAKLEEARKAHKMRFQEDSRRMHEEIRKRRLGKTNASFSSPERPTPFQ